MASFDIERIRKALAARRKAGRAGGKTLKDYYDEVSKPAGTGKRTGGSKARAAERRAREATMTAKEKRISKMSPKAQAHQARIDANKKKLRDAKQGKKNEPNFRPLRDDMGMGPDRLKKLAEIRAKDKATIDKHIRQTKSSSSSGRSRNEEARKRAMKKMPRDVRVRETQRKFEAARKGK